MHLGIWAVVQVALHLTGTGAPRGPRIGDLVLLRGVRPPGQTIPFGPLWFLGVYLLVVSLSPSTVRLHRRGGWVIAVMGAGAVVCDLVGFIGGQAGSRYFNVVFVLLLPHQLGHFYGDGSLLRWPRHRAWAMVVTALGGLILLTNPWLFRPFGDDRFRWFPGIGHYPRSLLGIDVFGADVLAGHGVGPHLAQLPQGFEGGVEAIGRDLEDEGRLVGDPLG
ncbi:MAG: hypothetical protein ACRDZ3_10810 [Acidimicrobiia bacterium]